MPFQIVSAHSVMPFACAHSIHGINDIDHAFKLHGSA
nr:hypothetical protein HUO10_006729 [Paraburkholderia busanensis]